MLVRLAHHCIFSSATLSVLFHFIEAEHLSYRVGIENLVVN